MAGSYDPLHDIALTLAAAMHAVVTNTTLDVEPLMRLSSRLGINHGTDPAEIEDKLRGVIERRVRREAAKEILKLDAAEQMLARDGARNVGPYGDAVLSLRRLVRGEDLPDVSELRGGSGA